MLLKKMKLRNFRQFYGEQEIVFSTSEEKNVTIIMGQNGAGKTTLAQAFTWCLYGETDFQDKNVLSKVKELNMDSNSEVFVSVEIALNHLGKDYIIKRSQRYCKNSSGKLKRPDNTRFNIGYKMNDGQQEFVDNNKTDIVMKEILPNELSKYFFFDGERIGNMSKEISKGKVQEFANAVRGLLGLNAIMAGINHLRLTIKSYDKEFDSESDSKIKEYSESIERSSNEIEKIDKRLEEIDNEKDIAADKVK